MRTTFTPNPVAILDLQRAVERTAQAWRDATAKALMRIAQRVRAKAILRAPRNERGRLARQIQVRKVAQNLEEIAVWIESGGGDLGKRVFAIHNTDANYTRGESRWLSSAMLDELRTWPDGLAREIRRHLPREYR